MIRFIGWCSYLIFGIIGEILNIPITLTFGDNQTQEQNLITFGVVLIIIVMGTYILKFFFGGRGD